MFDTHGVSSIVSISELRSETAQVSEWIEEGKHLLIQRNNEPTAVLMRFDEYLKLTGSSRDEFELPQSGT